jgi:putative endonuclease
MDGYLYYGSTSDLTRRLQFHRQGKVRSTKPRLPIELVYYKSYSTVGQARKRERGLKNGRTRSKVIQWLITTFPKEKLLAFV